MAKLLFSLLLVGSAGGSGLAIAGGWLNYKLFRLDSDKRRKPLGLLLLGGLIQNGILTYAIADIGTASPSGRAWLYTLGMAVSTAALGWLAAHLIQQLAKTEAES